MPDTVIIGNRLTWANPVVIPAVANLQCSWEIDRPGVISFDLPMADYKALGLPTDDRILSKWVRYVHSSLGTWGGQVTNISGSGGQIIINGESWMSCLRGQVTKRLVTPGVFLPTTRLRNEIARVAGQTGISAPAANFDPSGMGSFGSGYEVSLNDPWLDVLDVLIPGLLDYILERRNVSSDTRNDLRPAAVNVDPVSRQASFKAVYGRLLDGTVIISHGNQIHASTWSDDLQDHYNAVVMQGQITVYRTVGKGKKKRKIPFDVQGTGFAESPTLIAKFGRRTYHTFTDEPYLDQQRLNAKAKARLDYLLRNRQQVSIEVPNVNDIWAKFREGDVIGVSLPLDGVVGKMVARARAYSSVGGTLVIGGEATVQ